MNEKLNNIFVTVDVANMAKEKGFDEWCACSVFVKSAMFPQTKSDKWAFQERKDKALGIPTHYQLIKWLKDKHDIDVKMLESGLFKVIDQYGNRCYNSDDDNEFEINESLTIALNQIP